MKQSKYNFFYKLDNGDYLAYNALRNGLAVLSAGIVTEINSLQPGQYPKIDERFIPELEKGGFICSDDYDEYDTLVVRNHMRQYSTHALGLTIAPTLRCNLECAYCFEPPDTPVSVMDDNVIKSIVDFVKLSIDSGIKEFSAVWYGGEPLLCLDVIEKLSSEFIETCEKNKVKYSAFIITNGVLLTRDAAEKLKELKVTGAQVTIDGDKEVHNKRRPFKNGKGSFDIIWENLKAATGVLPISMRINVDKTNVDKILAFLDDKKKEEWFENNLGKSIHVHYGYVNKYTNSCRCSMEDILKPGDFWEKELELQKYLHKKGEEFNIYPNIYHGCTATACNAYVVGPGGELYKCWNHTGDARYVVGNISGDIKLNPLLTAYLAENFEKDNECRECKVLPICMGGCADIRVKVKRGEFDSKDCANWKFYLEDALREYYLAKIQTGQKEMGPGQHQGKI